MASPEDLIGAAKRVMSELELCRHRPFFIARIKIKLALHKTKKMINSLLHGGHKKDEDPSKPHKY